MKSHCLLDKHNRPHLSWSEKCTDAATNGFKQPFLCFITGDVRPRTIATRPSFVAWNTDINISYLVFCCPRGFVWTFFVGFQLFSLFLLHFACEGLSWRAWLGLFSVYDWQVQCEYERSQVYHHQICLQSHHHYSFFSGCCCFLEIKSNLHSIYIYVCIFCWKNASPPKWKKWSFEWKVTVGSLD